MKRRSPVPQRSRPRLQAQIPAPRPVRCAKSTTLSRRTQSAALRCIFTPFFFFTAADRLTPAEALPNGGDGRKLDGAPQGTAVLLEQGYFCAILPGEAHMVGGKLDGAEGSVDKWVVKVPATDAYRVDT